jgi:hypothetical protein
LLLRPRHPRLLSFFHPLLTALPSPLEPLSSC